MKQFIQILSILISIPFCVTAQKVNVTSIVATDKVVSSQLHGFQVDIQLDKYYSIGADTLANIFLSIFKDGQAVYCNDDYSIFCNAEGEIHTSRFFNKSYISFFIPYYTLKIKPGKHELEAVVTANYSIVDTNQTDSRKEPAANESYSIAVSKIAGKIECGGKNEVVFNINQPKLLTIKVRVNELRITEQRSKGGVWDIYSKPDLRFKIYMSNSWYGENVYISPNVKNTYSAAWLDYSNTLYMTEDDVFCIYVVDNDPLFDDTIALYKFTKDSFIKAIDQKEDLTRDDVTHIIMSYED